MRNELEIRRADAEAVGVGLLKIANVAPEQASRFLVETVKYIEGLLAQVEELEKLIKKGDF